MILPTERLLLREIASTDFDAVHGYASDLEVVQYMTWGPNTEQDTHDFLEQSAAQSSTDPRMDYSFAVVRREDERMMGAAGLHMKSADAHEGMLGYCYAREAWGHGYATEAARAMLTLGFDALGLHRVWAGCDPDNAGSIRVLEKLGMSLEGHFRDNVRIRGVLRDSLAFGILADEWTSTGP
jgi:ribosomal-protein-alanine N-acetyltransferase